MRIKRLFLKLYNWVYATCIHVYDYVTAQRCSISVRQLMMPYLNGDPSVMQLITISRLLDIENYCIRGRNDFHYMNAISKNEIGYNQDVANSSFEKLINSFLESGYNPSSKLTVDKDFHLLNGTHRLAMCLYLGVETVNILRLRRLSMFYLGLEYIKRKLSTQDYQTLIRRYNMVVNEC